MHWLLIGYMFLFIHRPFEVWPALGEIRLELLYMLVTGIVWLAYPGKRWLANPFHAGVVAFKSIISDVAVGGLAPPMIATFPGAYITAGP